MDVGVNTDDDIDYSPQIGQTDYTFSTSPDET